MRLVYERSGALKVTIQHAASWSSVFFKSHDMEGQHLEARIFHKFLDRYFPQTVPDGLPTH